MRQALGRRRAMRAGLALAAVLAFGFAADALVVVTTRAGAHAATTAEPHEEIRRTPVVASLPKVSRPGGSYSWSTATVGLTLILAACGGLIAAGRRFLPQGAGAGMHVVGRVSLSHKHAVYMLQVGRRTLLVGVGPQGAPSLITEVDELAELEPHQEQQI